MIAAKEKSQQEKKTYEILKKQIETQDKRRLVYGFTPEQQKEFDNGISVEEYFEKLDKQ